MPTQSIHSVDGSTPTESLALGPAAETEVLRLSPEDQLLFAEALLNPPEPNETLRRAMRLHDENVEMR